MRKSKFVKQITCITVAVVVTLFCCRDSRADNPDSQAKSQEKGLKGILNLGDIYYSKYNLDMAKPDTGQKNEDYKLFSIPLQLRYNFILSDEKRKEENIYLAPYVNYIIRHDVGNNSWNNVYWNNNQITAIGLQLGSSHDYWYPNYRAKKKTYIGGLYLSLFLENQWRNPGKSKDSIPSNIAHENFCTGINVWYAQKNLPLLKNTKLWLESWGQIAYQSTNFNDNEKTHYLIANIAPKAGISVDSFKFVEPYVTINWKRDIMDIIRNKEWNDKPWNNSLQYGIGGRIALNKIFPLPGEPYIYSEYLHIDYLSETQQNRKSDLKAGVSYWVKIF